MVKTEETWKRSKCLYFNVYFIFF